MAREDIYKPNSPIVDSLAEVNENPITSIDKMLWDDVTYTLDADEEPVGLISFIPNILSADRDYSGTKTSTIVSASEGPFEIDKDQSTWGQDNVTISGKTLSVAFTPILTTIHGLSGSVVVVSKDKKYSGSIKITQGDV